MKWALLFLVLSGDYDETRIDRPQILKTFVVDGDCVIARDEERQRVEELYFQLGPSRTPKVFIECVPYMGPWKQETGLKDIQ